MIKTLLIILAICFVITLTLDIIKFSFKIFKNWLAFSTPFFHKPVKYQLKDDLYLKVWYKYTYISNPSRMIEILDWMNEHPDEIKQILEENKNNNNETIS